MHTPGDDVYRAITRRTGTGHHAVLFTTPATLPSYVRLRITGNAVSTGNYFVVDNFLCNKYTAVTQTAEVATDFNTAVMSGVNVSSDGLLWTPLNSSITSFSVVGSTDKKLKVTCASVDEAWLKLETSLAGGRNYILRFAMTQDTATKRLGLRLYARTGGTWAMTETQGLIYTGNGHYLVNFTHPAGADAIRINFLRSNNGQTYDGYNTPYTMDDFSISRLDTAGTRTVTVCDPPAGGEEEGLYRYGFNGKENDNEVKGEGNQQDYGMRIYDPRVGRFLSIDPLTQSYPHYTPYQFAGNNPIFAIDIDGLEPYPSSSNETIIKNVLRSNTTSGMWIPNSFHTILDQATSIGGSNFKYGAWWRLSHGIGGTKKSGAIGVVGEAYAAAGEFSPIQGLSNNMGGQNGFASITFPNTQPRLRKETSDFVITFKTVRDHNQTLLAHWADGSQRDVPFVFKADKTYNMYYEVKTLSEDRNSPSRLYQQIEDGYNQLLNNIANTKVGTIHILYMDKEAYMKVYNIDEYKYKLNRLFSKLEQEGGGAGFIVLKENFYKTVDSLVDNKTEEIKNKTDRVGNDGKTY